MNSDNHFLNIQLMGFILLNLPNNLLSDQTDVTWLLSPYYIIFFLLSCMQLQYCKNL